MNHFKLTPFDERYQALPFEWLEWSYVDFMNTPDPARLRDCVVKDKMSEPDDDFKDELDNNTNLSDEDKQKIFDAIKARG
ncbi:MAG: hypothetical protein PQJ59_16540 [Spirochaetales bacterium]|nr:hypothetical protein [Spirochaetales bacterium]